MRGPSAIGSLFVKCLFRDRPGFPYTGSMVEGLSRIGELARRTGVSTDLLRAWERRYGLLSPTRSAGNYRLYSTADETRVRAMNAQVTRGVPAGEAARMVLAGDAPPAGDFTLAAQELGARSKASTTRALRRRSTPCCLASGSRPLPARSCCPTCAPWASGGSAARRPLRRSTSRACCCAGASSGSRAAGIVAPARGCSSRARPGRCTIWARSCSVLRCASWGGASPTWALTRPLDTLQSAARSLQPTAIVVTALVGATNRRGPP